MHGELLFLESPVQIGIVLLIALIVFGPKKLPEIGRQIGQALRELRKASNEVMNAFNADHEPEPYRADPYNYDNTSSYGYSTQYDYSVPHTADASAPVDLTDYTIVGLPVNSGASTAEPAGIEPPPPKAEAAPEAEHASASEAGMQSSGEHLHSEERQRPSVLTADPGKEGTHHD